MDQQLKRIRERADAGWDVPMHEFLLSEGFGSWADLLEAIKGGQVPWSRYDSNDLPAVETAEITPENRLIGSGFDPELVRRRGQPVNGRFRFGNIPGGAAGADEVKSRITTWTEHPAGPLFVLLTGQTGTGKSTLATILSFHAARLCPSWPAAYIKDRPFRDRYLDWTRHPETTIDPLDDLRNHARIIVIDDFGVQPTHYGMSTIWLESLEAWRRRRCLVIVCSNLCASDLRDLESSLAEYGGAAPVTSRLTGEHSRIVTLGDRDYRQTSQR